MNSALENSTVAIKRLSIDEDRALFNKLNRLEHYGGVSTTDLNSLEIDFSISILSLGEIFLIEGVSTINQKILPPTHAVAEIR